MKEIWNWIISYESVFRLFVVILVTVLAIIMRRHAVNALVRIGVRLVKYQIPDAKKQEFDKAVKPLTYLFSVFVFQVAAQLLIIDAFATTTTGITVRIVSLIRMIPFNVIYIILIGMLLTNIVDFFIEKYKQNDLTKNLNATLLHMTFKVVRVLIWVIIAGMVLSEMGYNVTGIFAGLGIGGIAFALAAQDTVSNLFGCLVILMDKPFEINDWIQTNDVEGIVEEINFRSTRIRTFQNALVAVPNSTLASSVITNWSQMKKRKLRFYINLTYSTTEEQIKEIKRQLTEYLTSSSFVEKGSVMVNLEEMSSSSLDLRVDAVILRNELPKFLEVREQINFKVMEIVSGVHADFAFPSQSIYIEKQ